MKSRKRSDQNRTWGAQHLFSILFMLTLVLPVALSILGVASPALDANELVKPPGIDLKALLAPEYYAAWGSYVDERLGSGGALTRVKRWVDYKIFRMTDVRRVHVGRQGWLFPQASIEQKRTGACDQRQRLRQTVFELTAISHLAEMSGRRLVLAITPDKASIYPEYLGPAPHDPQCNQTIYDIFMDECELAKASWLVRLDDLFKAAKASGDLLYEKTGSVWNRHGADLAAEALLQAVFKNEVKLKQNEHDLAALVLGGPDGDPKPSASVGHRFSSAVLYGGTAMNQLIPMLSPHFNRTDAISTDTIPSPNHQENLSRYDVVMIVLDGARIGKLHFDLDRILDALGVESLAEQANSIPLRTISGQSHLALRAAADKLEVKSLGAGASFSLPSLPGSQPHALRVLALELAAPTADTLRWQIDTPSAMRGEKPLGKGDNHLYFPLPVQPSVRLHIYPGRHTGLFYLSKATVLEYAKGLSLVAISNEGRQAWSDAPDAADVVEANEAVAPLSPVQAADGTNLPMIRLNDFEEMRIFQRTGKSADIVISGVFHGQPHAIEARVSTHATEEWSTPWTVIDSTPTDNVFMGILPEVPQGGWYRLAVRFSSDHQVMDTGQSRWGIGMLVACIGQSNMKEWFHNGSDLVPHSLLGVHRDGRWMTAGDVGNGAIAFGNRLIGKLGIPVGLLDYAINGSGLRKEADWGAGYWLDRSHASIYERFIRGVADTGGALEYVVWMQGEADAARATITENQYRSALKTFIEQHVRQDIVNGSHLQNLPCLIVGMVKRPVGKDAPHQAIRMAQRAVAEETQDCHLSATSVDLENMGRQHLSPAAYTTLGLRVAQTVLYLTGEESYYRGPSVVDATTFDDKTIDIRIAHRGGYDFSPQTAISGWEVVARGASLPIAQITRKDANTIRISMAEAFSGPVKIRYLYGAMPDAGRAIHDNSPMELPLEPAELTLE